MFERNGLQALVERLESLPRNRRCVPNGVIDAEVLLQDMKKVLADHMNDDPTLACNGQPIIRWPKKRDKKPQVRPRPRPPSLPPPRPPFLRSGAASRRRRTRCKSCQSCVRAECGVCHYCRDMKKFGGPGRMKQSCVLRQCQAPILPHTALCMICEEVGQTAEGERGAESPATRGPLMECSTCGEIVHPRCLKLNSSLGVVSQEMPNCWRCPKCVLQGQRKQALARRAMSVQSRQPVKREEGVEGEGGRRLLLLEAARRRLGGVVKRRNSDYLLLRRKRIAAAEQCARHKIKFEREQILLRTKRKAEVDPDRPSRPKLMRPLNLSPFPSFRPRRPQLSPSASPSSLSLSPRRPPLSEIERAKIGGSLCTVRLHRPPAGMCGPRAGSRGGGGCPCGRGPGPLLSPSTPAPSPSPSSPLPEDQMMQRHLWLLVFRYLSQKELCVCMRVCRAWCKWCCDKRLWTQINLSRCKSITPLALSSISRRLPVSLDLSWSNISRKQLTWLVNRLTGLKDLFLSGCSWSAISALSTHSCPLLRTLDLRWAEGLRDAQMRELFCSPDKQGQLDNRSKLRNVTDFRLSGLDISDVTLRLIIRHMPLLSRLDLSHCSHLSDHSLNLLTAVGSSTRNSLSDLQLEGCNQLTDECLLYLRRISNISRVNLRNCKHISRAACETLLSDLSVCGLFCLSDDKEISKIS